MSTIKVDNIRIASESVSRTARGVAAAWVTFKGTNDAVIEGSLNESSLVDNDIGDYTLNLTSSFSSVNYAYSAMGGLNTTSLICVTQPRNLAQPTVSSIRHQTVHTNSTLVDPRIASIAYHGDLA